MKKSLALSTAALAATFALCRSPLAADTAGAQQQAQQAGQRAEQQAGQRAEQECGVAGEMKMNADQHFIKEAAADNQFEIELSQFVEKQAQDPQVKQLAQRLIQDHKQAQEQLQEVAKGLNMQLSPQLEQWQQDKLQAMQQKHGKHLEMHYTFGQVGDHTTDLLTYRYEAEHAENAQLKQYAEKTIPVLESHLAMAQQAADMWVPQGRTAGEQIHGTSKSNTPGDQQTPSRGTNNQGINR